MAVESLSSQNFQATDHQFGNIIMLGRSISAAPDFDIMPVLNTARTAAADSQLAQLNLVAPDATNAPVIRSFNPEQMGVVESALDQVITVVKDPGRFGPMFDASFKGCYESGAMLAQHMLMPAGEVMNNTMGRTLVNVFDTAMSERPDLIPAYQAVLTVAGRDGTTALSISCANLMLVNMGIEHIAIRTTQYEPDFTSVTGVEDYYRKLIIGDRFTAVHDLDDVTRQNMHGDYKAICAFGKFAKIMMIEINRMAPGFTAMQGELIYNTFGPRYRRDPESHFDKTPGQKLFEAVTSRYRQAGGVHY